MVLRQAKEKPVPAIANCIEHPCARTAPTPCGSSTAPSAKEVWEAPKLEGRWAYNLPSALLWVQGETETGRCCDSQRPLGMARREGSLVNV